MKTTPIPVEFVLWMFSQFLIGLRPNKKLLALHLLALKDTVITVQFSMQIKLTWLALGEDHAARSRRVEQLTAL